MKTAKEVLIRAIQRGDIDTGIEGGTAEEITEQTLAALREAGYAIVPREPTYEMLESGARAASMAEVTDPVLPYDECDNLFRSDARNEVEAAYRAMLAAAEGKGE